MALPGGFPLFHDLSGLWHGGVAESGERYNFVMLDGHALSVSRARSDQLHDILFSTPN